MVQLDISFLPNDEVVLKANATLSERDLEATLKNIKAGLAREIRSHSLVLSLSSKSKESRNKEKNKKKAVEEAVEDWEAAEAMEEEKERLESGDASKVASGAATEDEAETTKNEADKDPRVETSSAGELAVSSRKGVEVEDEEAAPV
ncbi:putative single-stranded nucleic acid binding r3h [Diplodia seriata]|uniref:Putative single-stranded nucleic acid binding r3h n=1 Tax=Diplodia seriata TaxID=420778 RepID=A0A0G2E320_9PEZI|nr:putative single-stranded nucleic acid binding r3h [Diplodia seriata]